MRGVALETNRRVRANLRIDATKQKPTPVAHVTSKKSSQDGLGGRGAGKVAGITIVVLDSGIGADISIGAVSVCATTTGGPEA
jgi:hypothetical protein